MNLPLSILAGYALYAIIVRDGEGTADLPAALDNKGFQPILLSGMMHLELRGWAGREGVFWGFG